MTYGDIHSLGLFGFDPFSLCIRSGVVHLPGFQVLQRWGVAGWMSRMWMWWDMVDKVGWIRWDVRLVEFRDGK